MKTDSVETPPFSRFEWMLAGRYLRARRQEGFISVIAGFSFLGILLGVATLIIVMAVMNGFREELLSKMLGLNGHVIAYAIGRPFEDYTDVAQKLSTQKYVKHVLPLVEGQIMVSTPNRASGALVRGVRKEDLKSLDIIASKIVKGSLDRFGIGRPTVVIGTEMAKQMGVTVGSHISLINPRGAHTPFGTSPRVKRYQVSAIFKIGMSEYDTSVAFLPLAEAQKFFNKRKRVDAIEILLDNPDRVLGALPTLQKAVSPDISFRDWTKRNQTFFNALNVERNVMFLILTLIVLVAALNIISGMIMLVKDKSRDIAVLRTMGASRGSIMRIFLITGASIGIVGTLAGLIIGVLFCENIESVRQFISWLSGVDVFNKELYFLAEMPAKMEWREVTQVVIMALILSVLATLYPAARASKMDPVEALRYE